MIATQKQNVRTLTGLTSVSVMRALQGPASSAMVSPDRPLNSRSSTQRRSYSDGKSNLGFPGYFCRS